MKLKTFENEDFKNKKIFLRFDADVPIKKVQNSKLKVKSLVGNDARLEAVLPTLDLLFKKGAQVILAGHLGRPDPNLDPKSQDPNLSMLPISEWFAEKLKVKSEKSKIGEFDGWRLGENVSLLENLRFYPGEEKNDTEFSKKLASLAEVYINDAFAVCHRSHASIVGVAKLLPGFAGLRVEREISVLSSVLEKPKRPLVVIVGGAKIETKLPLVYKMHGFADYILVGGELAEQDEVILKVQHEKTRNHKSVLLVAELNDKRTDITEKSVENFLQIVNLAETVVWNGPVGFIEDPVSSKGTEELAKGIVKTKAFTVLGGGDTVGFLEKKGLLQKFSFVSTGGGAMLDFLASEDLPGLKALRG